jgi:hypothetical protein
MSMTAWNPWGRLLKGNPLHFAPSFLQPLNLELYYNGRSRWSGLFVPLDFGASVRYVFLLLLLP